MDLILVAVSLRLAGQDFFGEFVSCRQISYRTRRFLTHAGAIVQEFSSTRAILGEDPLQLELLIPLRRTALQKSTLPEHSVRLEFILRVARRSCLHSS